MYTLHYTLRIGLCQGEHGASPDNHVSTPCPKLKFVVGPAKQRNMQECLGVLGAYGPAVVEALPLDHIEVERKGLAFVGMDGGDLFPHRGHVHPLVWLKGTPKPPRTVGVATEDLRHGIEGTDGLAQKAGNQRTAKDKGDCNRLPRMSNFWWSDQNECREIGCPCLINFR